MKNIIKFRWLIFTVIIVLTAVLFFTSPNLTKQAEEAGTFQLEENSDSVRAAKILEDAGASADMISIAFALDENLNDETKETINQVVTDLQNYGEPVNEVVSPFENEELENQFVSEDQKTVLLPITVDGEMEEIYEFAQVVREEIIPSDVTAYVTGEAIINQDVNLSAQEGLERTEIITVVLIFVLLLAVFRSLVTPLVPLVSVGLAYLISQSIVAFFIDWFNFPVSNYTQIFLVAVLFGIGTDYCILLLSRYKEELSEGHDVTTSIINTYRTAGKTLIASAISGFVAFIVIIFADFPIYKSAAGVAIGVATLLIILLTIMPFFMAVLKDKLFWPSKKAASHSDSKLWKWFSNVSVLRPILSILIVAVITVPILFTYDNDKSYNTLEEIGDEYESVKGLDRISEAFGKGDSLPIQVIINSEQELVTPENMIHLELLSEKIDEVNGVDAVRSMTRPTGTLLEDIKVTRQYELIEENLPEVKDGLSEIEDGLVEIDANLEGLSMQVGPELAYKIEEFKTSIDDITNDLQNLTQLLDSAENIPEVVSNSEEIKSDLEALNSSMNQLGNGLIQQGGQAAALGTGITQMAGGINEMALGIGEISTGLDEAKELVLNIEESKLAEETGLFIPESVLEDEAFESVLSQYSFGESHGLILNVVLDVDPYSAEAITILRDIKSVVNDYELPETLAKSEVAYSGIPSINSDLEDISSKDYVRTIIIMLIGLFIILLVFLRSIVMPIYMIGSLLLTYFTTVSIAELIFVNLLGFDGITWAVPFFGFVMLVALGVDYSIFLLERYREEIARGNGIKEAMKTSMAKMGTVIITAAIILAGTFGAMMPSGVLSLLQIASIVITGLLLYGFIVLPLLIPAVTVLLGKVASFPSKLK
ncbi:MMPL family transporter [Bacillaceae bacterium W0354]